MSGTTGRRLNLRLFLEGQETPIISAQVAAKITSPATASIQVVATDKILNLKPRTLVHLFFLDSYETDIDGKPYPPLDAGAAAKKQGLPETVALNDPAQNRRYKLLFSGEVLGLGFAKTSGARQAVLKCADFTSYWDNAKQYYKGQNVLSKDNTNRVISFVGGSVKTYNSFLGYGSSGKSLYEMLTSTPATKPGMKGLLGGLIHVLESMGGVAAPGGTRFKGVNDFFSMAELRLRLMEMLGALENDSTAKRLMGKPKFRKWLTKKIRALGGIASFRDVINEVMGHIHHITAPNPAAYYSPGTKVDITVSRTTAVANKDAKVLEEIKSLLTSARRLLTKSETMLAHTTGNMRYRDPGGTSVQAVEQWLEDWIAQPSGDSVNFLSSVVRLKIKELKTAKKNLDQGALSTWMSESSRVVAAALTASNTVGGLEKATDAFDGLAAAADAAMKGTTRTHRSRKKVDSSKGLFNTLLIPECWWVAPPRCNIIFPEMYGSFSFSRSFLRETTRLQITVASRREIVAGTGIYSGLNFGGVKAVYQAPSTKLMKAIGVGPGKKQVQRLMPHEIHGGIIAAFEWMGQINQLLPKAKKGSSKSFYINRLVSYQLLKRRFSARTLAGSGMLNPYLVAGFPAVVIDRTVTPSMAEHAPTKTHGELLAMVKSKKVTAPTQYVGLVHSVTHQVDQSGGSTAFQLSHVRTHDEDVEFLGLDRKAVKKDPITYSDADRTSLGSGPTSVNEKIQSAIKVLIDAEIEAAKTWLHVPGELAGEVWEAALSEAIEHVSSANTTTLLETIKKKTARAKRELEFARTEFLRTGGRDRTSFSSLEVWLGAVQRAKDLLATVQYQKTETRYGLDLDTGVPVEEAIRIHAPFYDEMYGNDSIGEQVYRVLIGIGAITDKLDAKTTTLDVGAAEKRSQELQDKKKSLEELADFAEGLKSSLPVGRMDRSGKKLSALRKGTESSLAFTDRLIKEALFLGEGFKSVEDAVNALTILYHYVEREGLDKSHFIGSYTRRPIATMVDIFGGTDKEGKPVEGFHQYAFGDVDPMTGGGPWPGSMSPVSELGEAGNPSVISPKLDPRREKYLSVQEYLNELRQSRGLRG